MIGSGLKKLASEHNMKVAHDVAYGSMNGFAVTLSEGSGYKRMAISTKIREEEKLGLLQVQLSRRNLQKEFRVKSLELGEKFIDVIFLDNPGTMKKIYSFIEWFFPMLEESGAAKADVCAECGMSVADGKWKLINGCAHYMHESCAQRVLRDVELEQEQNKLENRGSYAAGFVGALLGAALGAVAWAALLYFGYVASIVGLLIGFLALKGYDLLKGKQGKGKVVILVIAIVLGVLLGTFGGYLWQLAGMIGSGELPGMSYGDLPYLFVFLLADSEFLASAAKDILMGLLFAGLGTYGILRNTGKEVAGFKMTDLE